MERLGQEQGLEEELGQGRSRFRDRNRGRDWVWDGKGRGRGRKSRGRAEPGGWRAGLSAPARLRLPPPLSQPCSSPALPQLSLSPSVRTQVGLCLP